MINLGDHFVIVPQVMAKFIRIVSDPKRFERPLPIPEIIKQAKFWWNLKEVEQAIPDFETMAFLGK